MAKRIPDFASEEEERKFWETHDAMEYINWNNAKPFVDKVFKDKKKTNQILDDLLKRK